jgi:putative NIF3 family GTP cyclohydrolase 1 type 2
MKHIDSSSCDHYCCGDAMDSRPTGRTTELLLNSAFGDPLTTARFEGLCAGDPNIEVTRGVVCYAPTLEHLRRAIAEQRNLLICREHPFFLHGGVNYTYDTEGLETAIKNDPVVEAKSNLIAANKLMVYRFGAAWDQFRPQAQSSALARALGLGPAVRPPADRSRAVVCDLPGETSLLALAQSAVDRLKCRSPRTVGDFHAKVNRVGVIAGETDPKEALGKVLSDSKIDGVIAGAGGVIDEVDGAISYFRDVMATGRRIALLAVGYGPSEDPGVHDMAKWMQGVLPDLQLEWWPTSDPSWIPRR